MKKQLIAGVLLVLILSTVIAYRVRAQNAYKHAPSGGSATLEGTESVVAAKVAGRLSEVLVQEGDTVTAGQIVAKLDCEDQQATLALAEARVKQAEAQVAVAETGVVGAKDATKAAQAQVAVASARSASLDVQRKKAERDRLRASTLTTAGAATDVDLDRAETAEKGLAAESQAASATIGAAALSAKAQSATIGTADAQVMLAKTGLVAAPAARTRRPPASRASCRRSPPPAPSWRA